MAMTKARTWALFKMIRVLVYSISMLLSMGFTAIYAVLLLRGWSSYSVEQRAVVISLLAINALSSITLYLMLIFRFRLWLDGIRVAFLLLFQVGGTVAIALFNPNFPCNNLGSVSTCKTVENVAIYGGWSYSGLLVFFAFYLAGMSYVPEPTPRPNPEAVLALSLAAKKEFPYEKREKRSSMSSLSSASSTYSQRSYITRLHSGTVQNSRRSPQPTIEENGRITPYTYSSPTTPQYPVRALRPASPPHVQTTPYSQYRPGTPGSVRLPSNPGVQAIPYPQYRPGTPGSVHSMASSMAPSTVSNIRASTRQRYYLSNRMPAPQPRAPEQLQVPPLAQQKFFDPVSRQGTPMSAASNQSQYAMRQAQRQPQTFLSPPPGLGHVGNGLNFPRPPGYPRGAQYPARVTSPLASSHGRLSPVNVVSDNHTIGMQMREALIMRTPSPGIRSLNSPTSPDEVVVRPSRSNSASSVPRSPSPQHVSYSNLPTTPLSAVLPGHPDLPSPANGRHQMDEVRRYDSSPSPSVRLNDRPVQNGQYQPEREYLVVTPRTWVSSGNDKMGAVDYWRQH